MVRVLVAVAVALSACTPQPAIDRGRELFTQPGFSSSPSNVFSCATCHRGGSAVDPSRIDAGYDLHGAAHRSSWWGGNETTLLGAVNECYVEFMRGARLTPTDEDGRALLVYLESIAPDATSPALPFTVVKDITPACAMNNPCPAPQVCNTSAPDGIAFCDLPPGDAAKGATTWQRACSVCHGASHTGAGRLGDKVSIVPEESIQQHGTAPRTGARAITIEKARHGKFFAVGGNMAPYSAEALSDGDLADILTYLGL